MQRILQTTLWYGGVNDNVRAICDENTSGFDELAASSATQVVPH